MSPSPAATVARQRRSAEYADTKDTLEQAGPLRSIVRGDMWFGFHKVSPRWCSRLMVLESLVAGFLYLRFCGEDAESNMSKQPCAVKGLIE